LTIAVPIRLLLRNTAVPRFRNTAAREIGANRVNGRISIGISLLLLLLCRPVAAPAQDATEIVTKADQHLRGKTNIAETTMRIVRPDWSREMSLKSWEIGRDRAMILITAPARDAGTVFLKRGNEVWNWIPSIERIIKIPPSMMMQSWMGSDFTNDDLVKESSLVTDYTHAITGDSTIEGRDCWIVRLIPKPEAAVVWGKLRLWISKADYLELRAEYFDENGRLAREMKMSDVKKMGGRIIPTVMEMSSPASPGKSTILIYRSIEFDTPIADGFFSEQNMKRVR
jgi:outer membrane lipoprotein-sorting protein